MSARAFGSKMRTTGTLKIVNQCLLCNGPHSMIPSRVAPIHSLRRTLLTTIRRSTSFWAPSYPPQSGPSSWIPSTPPSPAQSTVPLPPLPGPSAVVESDEVDGRRLERKKRYLDSLMDKAGELSLRCSILDDEGNWTAEEGRYRKMDLCRAHDLDPRDLRKLDSLTPSLVPVIITRRSCILISILNIRALIKPDRVIIFESPGTEENDVARRFKLHLQSNVRAGLKRPCDEDNEDDMILPYEHRALESILVSTANALEQEMGYTRRLVESLTANLETDINQNNLRQLLYQSRRLAGFQNRAKYVKRAVEEVLESDEDLTSMYLTSKLQGRPRALTDHEQLELLLESFTKQIEEIVSEIDTTVANLQSTQEVAELMLDSGRNALLALDIKISIATLGIGSGALIAGLFGMNLATHIEDTPYAFIAVSGAAGVAAIIVYALAARILRRVRHVALVSAPKSRHNCAPNDQIAQSKADLDAAAAVPAAVKARLQKIPDYEQRWLLVRRNLQSRESLWDRIFHRNSFRRGLLGIRRAPAMTKAAASEVRPSPSLSVLLNERADMARVRERDAIRTDMRHEQQRTTAAGLGSSPTRPLPHTQSPRVAPPFTRAASSALALSSAAPNLPPIPDCLRLRVTTPSLDVIKGDIYSEDDVELVPEDEANLVVTPDALRQLVLITSRESSDSLAQNKLALRVGVESGGCHGYQYTMALTGERGVDDYVFQPEGVASIPLVVDLVSLGLLKGSTLHYATELIGSSFRLQDNPQAKDGGSCGCGVSWKAN